MAKLDWEVDILEGKVLIQRDLCGLEKLAGRNWALLESSIWERLTP